MGSIHFFGYRLLDSLVEVVGYKCGIAITREELTAILVEKGWERYTKVNENFHVRMRSNEYEDIVFDLLVAFGRADENTPRFPHNPIWHRLKEDERLLKIYFKVHEYHREWFGPEMERAKATSAKLLDPMPFITRAFNDFGQEGFEIADSIICSLNAAVLLSPWGSVREIEWTNEIELKDLFDSEGLNSSYGKFFDQRYIDFLHQNFPRIDSINWRKFEYLTGEFLDRQGFHVEMGKGRGDDGVDVRAWLKDQEEDGPQIIVQCKRQRNAVPKVVLKALYADVVHEKARSGLLVTTNTISPGAEDTRIARAYPIQVADRPTLREWLAKLRSPGVGDFNHPD